MSSTSVYIFNSLPPDDVLAFSFGCHKSKTPNDRNFLLCDTQGTIVHLLWPFFTNYFHIYINNYSLWCIARTVTKWTGGNSHYSRMILSIWGGRCKKCILKYNLLCQATTAAHRILGNCSLSIAPHYLSLTTLLNLTDKKLYERKFIPAYGLFQRNKNRNI